MASTLRIGATPSHVVGAFALQSVWRPIAVVTLVGWLYAPILTRLVRQWWVDPNISHGFVVLPCCGFLVWRSRQRLSKITPAPSLWGLVVLVLSASLLIIGVLGADIFLSRISFIVLVAGLIIFFQGWRFFRALFFPWALMFFMVPVPAIVFEQITFPLQLIASKAAAALLSVVGVPVLREGNIIRLPSIVLEVAEACSGIRSLVSLVSLATLYGYFAESRNLIRVALVAASVPIAVAANCLRIVGTGVFAHYWNPNIADGFLHIFSGLLIFAGSLIVLSLSHQALRVYARAVRHNR